MSLPYAIGFYLVDMIIIAMLYQLIYTAVDKGSKNKKDINLKVYAATFGIFLVAESLRNALSLMGIALIFVELIILTGLSNRRLNRNEENKANTL